LGSDFHIRDGRLHVPKTGVVRDIDWTLAHEAWIWSVYYLSLSIRNFLRRGWRPARTRIYFTPEAPRPWYLVRAAAEWAGIGVARTPEEANAAFYFDDVTCGEAPSPCHARALNFSCTDISKSRVAAVFAAVFGYPLTVDPATHEGPAVEKSEANGQHDGRLVTCPRSPVPGKTYQRLIDTQKEGFVYDLRTPCVGGRPVVVWIKKKRAENRFSIVNLSVVEHAPAAVYSLEELTLIERFAAAMGLDWGGLDILRETSTGRLYIVDVNKTDVGPVLALPWISKMNSTRALAASLTALIAPGAL